MSIHTSCPSCRCRIKTPDEAAGRRGKCPRCGAPVTIPAVPQPGIEQPRTSAPSNPSVPSRPTDPAGISRAVVGLVLGSAAIIAFGLVAAAFILKGRQAVPEGRVVAGSGDRADRSGVSGSTDSPRVTVQVPATDAGTEEPAEDHQEAGSPASPPFDIPPGAAVVRDEEREAQLGVIRDAVALEAPPLGQGRASNLAEFAGRMRTLATDEFAFEDARKQVFVATFDRRNLSNSPTIGTIQGRNVLAFPGEYDFDRRTYALFPSLWYDHQTGREFGDRFFPEETDSCLLVATIPLDEVAARRWKAAFDDGTLRLTLWFRFLSVERRGGRASTRHPGMAANDLVFRVEVLAYDDHQTPAGEGGKSNREPR